MRSDGHKSIEFEVSYCVFDEGCFDKDELEVCRGEVSKHEQHVCVIPARYLLIENTLRICSNIDVVKNDSRGTND